MADLEFALELLPDKRKAAGNHAFAGDGSKAAYGHTGIFIERTGMHIALADAPELIRFCKLFELLEEIMPVEQPIPFQGAYSLERFSKERLELLRRVVREPVHKALRHAECIFLKLLPHAGDRLHPDPIRHGTRKLQT